MPPTARSPHDLLGRLDQRRPRGLVTIARVIGLVVLAAASFLASAACAEPTIGECRFGFEGAYKLGVWTPLRVAIDGGEAGPDARAEALRLVVAAPDSDGVATLATTPGGKPAAVEPGRTTHELLYVRVGRADASVEVRLMRGAKTIDRKKIGVGVAEDDKNRLPATPSSGRLILELGGPTALTQAVIAAQSAQSGGDNEGMLHVAVLPSGELVGEGFGRLPTEWHGYEGIETIVVAEGPSDDWLAGVAPSDPRLVALAQWVEMGGRLVIACGARGADWFAPNGPLSDLAPGEFAGIESITTVAPIVRYAESDAPAPIAAGETVAVCRLADVAGRVEARAGSAAGSLPLLVRASRGMGEVVFVAVNLSSGPLKNWPGSPLLMAKLVGLSGEASNNDGGSTSGAGSLAVGQNDLAAVLRQRLDASFTGVSTPPFMAVVGLVIAYLLLIGPGDYLLVTRVLKRPEATWITFPLMVAICGGGAYWLALSLKGDQLRVNQVEMIDIDCSRGLARGTVWTHVFSPRAERYDLALRTRTPGGDDTTPDASYLAWMGQPGYGLGGMLTPAPAGSPLAASYAFGPRLGGVYGMPVQVWSTKTMLSRYLAPIDRLVDGRLSQTADGLVEGDLTNDTGAPLEDCWLLYGAWAWRLGDLADGETKGVDLARAPVKVNTMLREQMNVTNVGGGDNYYYFDHRRMEVESLAALMMFGERLTVSGGEGVSNGYQRFTDLCRMLDTGRAILLARCPQVCSQLVRSGGAPAADGAKQPAAEPLASEQDKNWVFCRYVMQVQE
ncbi:hypothetical protein Mal64_33170 [Pseudobythopirellula maris]|uniref:Glutamine amidotransferase domain-containing protein n=2 Tax=Pseudobythopirellula maris TaxID=2527991 RepID=A0A5C5ZGM5_9BACT|nr:hypothetical protein Mal64_33170 [Pseudobythopirellula maris]